MECSPVIAFGNSEPAPPMCTDCVRCGIGAELRSFFDMFDAITSTFRFA